MKIFLRVFFLHEYWISCIGRHTSVGSATIPPWISSCLSYKDNLYLCFLQTIWRIS